MSDGAIFCARCGAAGQRVNSYCRACGEWLPDPSAAWHPRGRLRGLSPERKRRRMRILGLLSALAAAASALIALSVRAGSDPFMRNYHKHSNVETTFHMIKAKFGDGLRSKTRRAQINETLCKVLCHNICCLIQSMFELGLRPKFWSGAA